MECKYFHLGFVSFYLLDILIVGAFFNNWPDYSALSIQMGILAFKTDWL